MIYMQYCYVYYVHDVSGYPYYQFISLLLQYVHRIGNIRTEHSVWEVRRKFRFSLISVL